MTGIKKTADAWHIAMPDHSDPAHIGAAQTCHLPHVKPVGREKHRSEFADLPLVLGPQSWEQSKII